MVIYVLYRRSLRGFLDSLYSILRSISVYSATRMCSKRFCRKSKLLTQIEGCPGGFSSRRARFRGLFKHITAITCAGDVFENIEAFNADLRVPRGFFEWLNSFPRSI